MIHRCFIYIRWKVSYHFFQPWMKNSYPGLQVHYLNSPRECKHLGQFKFLSRNSKVFKIYTKYLSFLVYNQVYNLFVCTLCCCLTSFQQWNWEKPLRNFPSLDMTRVTWKSRKALENIDLNQMRNRYVSGVLQNEPSDFRSFDWSLREC